MSANKQCYLASSFGIDQSTVSRYCKYMDEFFLSLGFSPDELANVIRKCKTGRELAKWIKNKTILIDGTQTRIQTPQDKTLRDLYNSGKKKAYTVNTLLTCTVERLIINVSKTFPGRTHDFTIFKQLDLGLGRWSKSLTNKKIPYHKRLYVLVDLGFQGIRDIFVGARIGIKFKKPKGKELTEYQKTYNKKINSKRATVEHMIGCVKQFKLLYNVFIGNDDQYNIAITIAATMVNYHILWDHENNKPSPRLEELITSWRTKIEKKKRAKLKQMKLANINYTYTEHRPVVI